jgi:hypothetical protein
VKDRAMFDSLHGVNLDPTLQPNKHRLLKLVGIPVALLAVALAIYAISRINVFPATVRIDNDTAGTLICYQRYQSKGHDFVQDAGRITTGNHANIQAKSSCSVFDTSGRYVSCLIVPNDKSVQRIAASTADRGVSAETCVYPR